MSGWPGRATTTQFPKHVAAYNHSHALPKEALMAAGITHDPAADVLCIPFPGTEGGITRRFDGKEPKFLAPEGWEPRLYFAPLRKGNWKSVYRTQATAIYWAEGPLKALAHSWHSGKPTIAASGLDGWCPRNPVADFDQVRWTGRTVVVLVDSDAAESNDQQKALRRLASHLETLGAGVLVKIIPSK